MKKGIKLILILDLIFNEAKINAINEIKNLFFGYSADKFADLIKTFNFSFFLNYKSEKDEKDFSKLNLIKKYIKFFDLIIENDLDEEKAIIKDIKFKDKNIESFFLLQYNSFFVNAIETDEKLQNVLNLNDGDFFEKLIILDIITGKIREENHNNSFIKLEVSSLFGLSLENFEFEQYKGKNIIFIQKNKTAEIFDFGILFKQNNQLIMKYIKFQPKKQKMIWKN